MFVRPAYLTLEEKNAILRRFLERDPSLWSSDEDVQEAIKNRLGWMDCFDDMEERLPEIKSFAQEVADRGIEKVVLLGMGGSSLAPLVLSTIFGSSAGHPELKVLDTTDPDEIEKTQNGLKRDKTLFIVASKSGTTIEPNALFAFFWDWMKEEVDAPGNHFIAITDPGSPLEELANEKGFLRVFLNRPDVGGRYSALTLFGLLPAALVGIDVDRLFAHGKEMASTCLNTLEWDKNPGCMLADFLGEYGVQSRDKLTLLFDREIEPFGLWLDQLVAESTGKETRGLVPIIGETTGIPGFYGGERIFVYTKLKDTPPDEGLDGFVNELREAEFPVYEIALDNPYQLGGQFFLWEMAVALTAHFFAVNPFDEPDVILAKEKTKEAIKTYRDEGKFPVKFWVDPKSNINFRASRILAPTMKGLSRTIIDLFQVLPTWGYVAFLPYLPYEEQIDEIFRDMRHQVRQEKGCATTMGYGPRYLHSSGQLHKGGPMSGGYFIFTRKRSKDYPEVPGYGMSFWHMQFAQAMGDFDALEGENRRVIHVHLPADYMVGLETFKRVLSRAIRL